MGGGTDAGLTMFLVPRCCRDGSRNAWTINRLKDKLGSRSMATGEVTFSGAVGHVVGDPARGFRQMVEMVNVSRLSNAMRAPGSCAVRAGSGHARARPHGVRPAARRAAAAPSDLLEMLLDAEAAASVVLNAAVVLDAWERARGGAADLPDHHAARQVLDHGAGARGGAEAMNVRGGNGYIEEWVNARLLRDSYLGGIWEGATNVVRSTCSVRSCASAPTRLDRLVEARLGTVTEAAVKPGIDAVRAALDLVKGI
jgi:alkylation response protein AidB-like acyl-CoA dehydrogenase